MSEFRADVITTARGITFTRRVNKILKPLGFRYRGFKLWSKTGCIVKATRITHGWCFTSDDYAPLHSLTVLDEGLTYNAMSMPPEQGEAEWPN